MADRPALRSVTPEVVHDVEVLIKTARSASVATIAPSDGWPIATRVGLAMFRDDPLIVVSALAAHTAALRADPRCSVLIGEIGKGDPLAHPRLTLRCRAAEISKGSEVYALARAGYLATNPKAQLYIDLGDFALMLLRIVDASYNAGFGKAYALAAADMTFELRRRR